MIGLAVVPRVFAAAVVAVSLSACVTRVGGAPVSDTPDKPKELTSEVVFDDLATVDPCSLTDLAVFDDLGRADYASPGTFDECRVDVRTDADDLVAVLVGELAVLDPDESGDRVDEFDGGLWVAQQSATPANCVRVLVFPDEVTLGVRGTSADNSSATCRIVEAAMAHVVKVVRDGGVKHRKPKERSLIPVDPCELVPDKAVREIPALAGVTKPAQPPSRHECVWQAGDSPDAVKLRVHFRASTAPEPFRPGAAESLVAGRETVTNPYEAYENASYCAVETGHILFKEVEGDDIVEVASVYVRMPAGQVTAACQAATMVAETAWRELPKS